MVPDLWMMLLSDSGECWERCIRQGGSRGKNDEGPDHKLKVAVDD